MILASNNRQLNTAGLLSLAVLCLSAVLPSPALTQNYAEPPRAPAATPNAADAEYTCSNSDKAGRTIRLCSPIINDPETSDNKRITALLKRAKAWVVEEELWAAINDYGKVVEIDPEYIDAYTQRAILYFELNEHALAKDDYTKILQIIGEDASTYCRRGLVELKLKDFKSAIDDYNEALRIDSKRSDCLVARGDVYAAMGKYEDALKDYNTALAANERLLIAYMRRGMLHKKLGKKQLAIADFTKVLDLNYFDLDAMRQLQYLGELTPWQ